jgi:hypothetical protein
MLFLALSPNNETRLIVRADAWHDANSYAQRIFSDVADRDRILCTPTEDVGQRVDAELAWKGTDAGDPPVRRLEVRDFAGGKWGKWRKIG